MTRTTYATESLIACPICSATGFIEVGNYPDDYVHPLVLRQCTRCQVVFLNPRLTPESTVQVENQSAVYNHSDETAESTIGHLQGLVRWLESHTGTRGAMLDVGCNRGFLLEAARRRGWQPFGIEIAPTAALHAQETYGLRVYQSMQALENELGADFNFHLITAWHVLEHTPDPVGFLRLCSRHLSRGGILALEVPSYDFVDEFRKRDQLGSLICAVHNTYFTAESIAEVINRAGLHVLEVRNSADNLLLTVLTSNSTHIRFHRLLRRMRSALPILRA